MNLDGIPFQTTDWSALATTSLPGASGTATYRTKYHGAIRIRLVDYSAGYSADHWCEKGHILLCLDGKLVTELRDGRTFELTPGVSYEVADGVDAHRSSTPTGARLFIVD